MAIAEPASGINTSQKFSKLSSRLRLPVHIAMATTGKLGGVVLAWSFVLAAKKSVSVKTVLRFGLAFGMPTGEAVKGVVVHLL